MYFVDPCDQNLRPPVFALKTQDFLQKISHRDSVAFASMKTTKMRTRDKMEAYD